VRSRAKADLRIAAVLAAAAVWLGPARAGAEVVYDLAPSAGFGLTDNANLTAVPQSDEYTVLSGVVRARYIGPLNNHSIGYRLAWTNYLEGHGINNLTNEASGLSNIVLSPTLDLHLAASGMLTRASMIALADPATGLPPQGVLGGTNLFLTVGGSEEVDYHRNGRWTYLESIAASRVRYLELPAPPDTTMITPRVRADLLAGRDSYSLEATAISSIGAVNSVMPELLAGWRREISVEWTSQIQAGVLAIFRENAPSTIGPAGTASLDYRRLTWFANLLVSRVPTPNLFLGAATVNNQAVLRATLPLNRYETIVVSGMAAYLYASPTTAQFTRAFDQRSASALIGARLGSLPLHASLSYSVLSQHNNPDVPTPAPNLFRQTLMLTLTGSFTFGPGTPPILGAPM
jgi:hypothetical protein